MKLYSKADVTVLETVLRGHNKDSAEDTVPRKVMVVSERVFPVSANISVFVRGSLGYSLLPPINLPNVISRKSNRVRTGSI